MGTGFSKKKKQAKQLQEQFSKMQQDLEKAEFRGQAGNGLVEVVLGGDHTVRSVKIHPDCVDPEDVEGLQDLLKVALGAALKQMGDAGGSGGLPGLEGLGGGMPDLGSLVKGFGF